MLFINRVAYVSGVKHDSPNPVKIGLGAILIRNKNLNQSNADERRGNNSCQSKPALDAPAPAVIHQGDGNNCSCQTSPEMAGGANPGHQADKNYQHDVNHEISHPG